LPKVLLPRSQFSRNAIFVQQLFVQNCTEFHENPPRSLIPDTTLRTDGRTDGRGPHIPFVLGKKTLQAAQKWLMIEDFRQFKNVTRTRAERFECAGFCCWQAEFCTVLATGK